MELSENILDEREENLFSSKSISIFHSEMKITCGQLEERRPFSPGFLNRRVMADFERVVKVFQKIRKERYNGPALLIKNWTNF